MSQVISAVTLSSISEYEALARFIESIQRSCTVVGEVAGQQQLHILSFLESLKHQTWSHMKRALSRSVAYVYVGPCLIKL